MTGAWLAICVLGKSDDLSRTVSVKVPVSNASRAIDSLAKQTGLRLSTVGPVGNEIIFLDVTNQPIREVLPRIAQATNAEWRTNSDGSLTLTRSKELLKKLHDNLVAKRMKELSDWRTEETAPLDQAFTKESINTVGNRLRRNMGQLSEENQSDKYFDPIYRALHRAIRSVDLAEVANLKPGQRIVYSSQPTKVQFALPSGILDNLIQDQNLWAQTMEKIDWKDDIGNPVEDIFSNDNDDSESSQYTALESSFASKRPFAIKPTLAVLSVNRNENDFVEFALDAYSATGKKLISLSTDSSDWNRLHALDGNANVAKGLTPPELSPETKAFWGSDPLAKSARPFYTQATQFDFLKPGNQEFLTQLALQKHKSVVASLSDSDQLSERNLEEMDVFVSKRCLQEDANWMVINSSPDEPERPDLIDRRALSTFCRNAIEQRLFDPRSFAALNNYQIQQMVSSIVKRVFQSEADANDHRNFATLFASLTDEQFRRLLNGQVIPYTQLSQDQIRLASTIVYGKQAYLWVGGQAKTDLGKLDSTFELPNGVQDGPGISLEYVSDEVVSYSTGDNSWSSEYVAPNRKEDFHNPGEFCGFGRTSADQSSLFKFTSRGRYTLRCFLSPSHWYAFDVSAPTDLGNSSAFRFKDLSADQQKRIKEYVPFVDLYELREKILVAIEKMKKLDQPEMVKEFQIMLEEIEKSIAAIK